MGLKATSGVRSTGIGFYCSLPGSSYSPCAYVRDTDNLKDYLKKNKFLRFLNNEVEHPLSEKYRERIKNLDLMLLIYSNNDKIIQPI